MNGQVTVDTVLTPEQAVAVARPGTSRTLIIAPAGTGKTHTLVHRLDTLLDGDLSADEVLMLSFSRAAVRELASRTASSTGRGRFVAAHTFDAWALELLDRTYTDQDWHGLPFDERIREATGALLDGHAEEFTASIRHLLLDEVQDLVGDRLRMVEALLTCTNSPFTIVGDSAQAIYGFQVRGRDRDPDLFSWVRETYSPDLVELALTCDFRARTPRPAGLLACGDALRAPNAEPGIDVPQMMREEFLDAPTAGRLEDILSGFDHLDGTIAILCGDNGQALEVSGVLHAAGVAHRLQHRAGDDGAPRWLASLFRGPNGLTVARAAFADQTGLTDEALDAAWQALRSLTGSATDRIDLRRLRSALAIGRLARLITTAIPDRVTVSSMHRAKGLEYDRVYLIERRRRDDDSPLEEARLSYMAMTRSRDDMFRLEPPPPTGGVYTRRSKHADRWGRYHFKNRWARHGMALEHGDVNSDFPAGTHPAADPEDLQEYLASEVCPGEAVTLSRSAQTTGDELPVPLYTVEHCGRLIGVVSPSFRRALDRYMRGGRAPGATPSWPSSITQCWIDDVETVAGSIAAGRRTSLGEHGVWLAPRLSGLSRFHYVKADTDDE